MEIYVLLLSRMLSVVIEIYSMFILCILSVVYLAKTHTSNLVTEPWNVWLTFADPDRYMEDEQGGMAHATLMLGMWSWDYLFIFLFGDNNVFETDYPFMSWGTCLEHLLFDCWTWIMPRLGMGLFRCFIIIDETLLISCALWCCIMLWLLYLWCYILDVAFELRISRLCCRVTNKNLTFRPLQKGGALQLVSEPGSNARPEEYEFTTASLKQHISTVDELMNLSWLKGIQA